MATDFMLDLESPFRDDGVILGGSLALGLALGLALAADAIFITGGTFTVSSRLFPPALIRKITCFPKYKKVKFK